MVDKKNFDVSMDRYKNNVRYSITLCPSDRLQFRSFGLNRFERYRNWALHRYEIFGMKYIRKLKLYPDLSFPTRIGLSYPRIHFHGYIEFADVNAWLLENRLDEYHVIEVDTIADYEVWDSYCRKWLANTKTNNYGEILTKRMFEERIKNKTTQSEKDLKANIIDMVKAHTDKVYTNVDAEVESFDSAHSLTSV